jgi:DNA-binding NarL/FixJ family response regulator
VYLQCVPNEGHAHLLGPARAVPATSSGGLSLRAVDGGTSELPAARRAAMISAATLPFGLTPAELAVLQAAAEGLTVPETARKLQKGSETVKTQRNKIILKIGARNMVHAVCIAAERGLVSADA